MLTNIEKPFERKMRHSLPCLEAIKGRFILVNYIYNHIENEQAHPIKHLLVTHPEEKCIR